MVSTSDSGTLWWYSNKTRNDGTPLFRITGRSTSFTWEIRGTLNPFLTEWKNSGRKRERQSSTRSLFHTSGSVRKQPRWRETSRRLHCSSESTWPNFLETQSRCSFLDKINQIEESRIAILANQIICNHLPLYCARRLHLSSVFLKRRSSIIREVRNTKASTQVCVKE